MKQKPFILVFLLSLLLLLSGCAVQDVENAIEEIGTVSMDALPAIEHAEQLYGELSERQQTHVENRQDLFSARDEYTQLERMLEEAVDAIQAIGPITLDSSERISFARSKYDTLNKTI